MPIYISDEEYELAADFGINRNLLNARIRKLGWDRHKALTEPVKKRASNAKWKEQAEANGICYSTFINRVHVLGWDREVAATKPPMERKEIQVMRSRRWQEIAKQRRETG